MKEQNSYWEKKNIWNLSGHLNAKFLRICPYGDAYLKNLVQKCIGTMVLFYAFSVSMLVLWTGMFESFSGIYLLESVLLALYLVSMEVPNYQLQKIENKIYRDLLMFFSRVKHQYMTCRHMANSIMDAADGMSYEIQKLAEEVYCVLVESDRKEKVRDYILYHKTNRYLKLFLIQAYEVSEKGDFFFAESMEHLRLELMEEIYRRRKRAHEFAGYVFVTAAPFFMMPVLRQWGIDFTQELEFFYAGTGVLLETVTFTATIVIYGMILQAKEIALFTEIDGAGLWNVEWLYENTVISSILCRFGNAEGKFSDRIKKLLLESGERISYGRICFQMYLLGISAFLVMSVFFADTHKREQKNILEQVDSIETIAPVAGEEKQNILVSHILEVTRQCRNMDDYTEEAIRSRLREKVKLQNGNIEQMAVQEIMKKLEQYEKTRGNLWEVMFCFIAGIAAAAFPLLRLYYQKQAISAGAVYEIRQFQSIILMERKIHGITIVGLLEDLEVFSRCFRSCLRRCINSYGAGPREALLRLKAEGSTIHDGFEELADAFLSVDEVGVELAFEEVESNRQLLEKMTQLEAEISIERKKDNTDLLAKIPMLLTVGAYFILPFFTYSMQGVYEIFELLEEMQL